MNNLKIIYLTNNFNSLELAEWLKKYGTVIDIRDRLTLEMVKVEKPDFIISYNYGFIITKDIIDYIDGKIYNLHISYLPWNRGASPNFWSFIDDTPKGVTIHQVDYGLDTGKILFQKKCFFDETKETFMSTYNTLQREIINLFKENWENIINQSYILKEQLGGGSYHKVNDLKEIEKKCPFLWTDNIDQYKKRYNNCVGKN